MVSTKEQIIQVVSQMDDNTAFSVWDMLTRHFNTSYKKVTWNDIEEVEPDEIDRQMLLEIKNDPNCKEFISEDELFKRLKG